MLKMCQQGEQTITKRAKYTLCPTGINADGDRARPPDAGLFAIRSAAFKSGPAAKALPGRGREGGHLSLTHFCLRHRELEPWRGRSLQSPPEPLQRRLARRHLRTPGHAGGMLLFPQMEGFRRMLFYVVGG